MMRIFARGKSEFDASERGAALLDALVALLVLSIGLAACMGLFMREASNLQQLSEKNDAGVECRNNAALYLREK